MRRLSQWGESSAVTITALTTAGAEDSVPAVFLAPAVPNDTGGAVSIEMASRIDVGDSDGQDSDTFLVPHGVI